MFLDTKVLELTQSVSYGSVTLKSLQNDNIPELDLLVREAIQNSSDAALQEADDSFTVKFNTGTFVPARFNTNLSGIEGILDEMFPGETADFLEIRDSKTQGLTGPLRIDDMPSDDHGNFFKLIFDTGKKQTQAGAGGNWGFGKSVYYRVGMGIVVFYSRIKIEGSYESRLIITLVENEENPDAILAKINPRSAGKAWWGIKEGKDDFLPITDDELILEILNVFGIPAFRPNETGTSIIIPYIDKQKLLKNIIPEEANISDDIRARCTWASNFEEYLILAIQKWYAPKIHNQHLKEFCNKKWLRVYVNNKPIRYDTMLPFFKLVQELYTIAIAKTYDYDYQSEWLSNAICSAVPIRNYFDTSENSSTAGYVAAIRINTEDMYGGQNYMDPCIYTRHFENDPDINEPIVMYSRDPGMVIEYTIAGLWVKGITPPERSDEYIFAFFVPITTKKLKADLSEKKYADMELGEYLRECEASDHMGWKDPANMQVVERIQKNTVNQIFGKIVSLKTKQIEATASKLSGKLGRKLLPRIGYGRVPRGGGSGGSGGGSKINNVEFNIISRNITEAELTIEYELKLTNGKKTAELTVLIDSEGGLIDPKAWQNDIGTEFPVEFTEVTIHSLSSTKEEKKIFTDVFCNKDHIRMRNQYIELNLDNVDEVYAGFKIVSNISSPVIKGKIKLKTADKKYRPSFKIV